VRLLDGRVLVAGGSRSTVNGYNAITLATAEIYSP